MEKGMKYVLEATRPSSTNEAVSEELSTIMNTAYASPLYAEGEKFCGAVVYKDKDNGEYIFRE